MPTFPVVAAALNYADRITLSTLLPVLATDLRSDDAQLGLIGSVFLRSHALVSPAAGNLADRYSRSRLTFASLMLWSLDNPARLWRGAAIPAGRIPP